MAVLIPTRGRPQEFLGAVQSVQRTSGAHVLAYVDEDEYHIYPTDGEAYNATIHVGERIGPVAAANLLVREHPEFDAYGLITDDSRITTPKWDQWLLDCIKLFPDNLVVVSPYHNHGNHVDMPFVSRQWVETVGWYACPEFHHYCWPIISGLIGEQTAIVHCPRDSFAVEHDYEEGTNMERRMSDNARFFDYVSLRMPAVVERLREKFV